MTKIRQGLQNMKQALIGGIVCNMLDIFKG